MEWTDSLKGGTVGLDTAPLIYFIEEHPRYLSQVDKFVTSLDKKELTVVTSTITLLEVLVHPLRSNDYTLASEYKDILLHSNMVTLEITHEISEEASRLRAKHALRTPDALQISAALKGGASHFLTNDIRLPDFPSIEIISLDKVG